MTLLHAHFNLRNFGAFQQLLDDKSQSAGPSTSGGKGSSNQSPLTAVTVNARDSLGRAVLHLACSTLDCIDYLRCILKHPAINVNIQDEESHWTPLHRALYHGNLPAALLLLQRSDIDSSLKDYEGYTAADLYNSTVQHTSPTPHPELHGELYTWGTNRNATLGLGDGDDRTYPESVILPRKDSAPTTSIQARFCSINIHQIEMSRLHTGKTYVQRPTIADHKQAVVTSEEQGNVHVCGFGSGGRLGPMQNMQYNFKPLAISARITAVALGQDHTLALTATGEVFSWGLNRFSQLGYVIETLAGASRFDEAVQVSPRKIHGPLKKEVICGVAASKMRSACYNSTGEVFSWGTHNGQTQVHPRKVTKVTRPVIAISLSDTAMACLLETQEVICIWNDRGVKINFPLHGFPSEIQPYRPPQALKGTAIAKIVSNDDFFVALSSNGELFTFSVPINVDVDNFLSKNFKPQRVWALRKQFSAVTDVAIGTEGSIIVCTKSGHVFLRSRNTSNAKSISAAGKAFRFQRMPFIQRVVKVAANQTGGFAALRVDHICTPIAVPGHELAQDLAALRPYMKRLRFSEDGRVYLEAIPAIPAATVRLVHDEHDDLPSLHDYQIMLQLLATLIHWKGYGKGEKRPVPPLGIFHGSDIQVWVGDGRYGFPAHRVILAARSPSLCKLFCNTKGDKVISDRESHITLRLTASGCLQITGCQAIAILLLLDYIYADKISVVWDGPLSRSPELRSSDVIPSKVKDELRGLARILGLASLQQLLSSPAGCAVPPSIVKDLSALYHQAQADRAESYPLPDVLLQFFDKEIYTYSVILRCRTEFFAAFFDDPDWTKNRWKNKLICIDLKHLKWRAMEYVIRFMCCGDDREMFKVIESIPSVDDFLDLVFEIMAVASELLLDRLVDLCAEAILQFVGTRNVSSIFSDAVHFHASSLVDRTQEYMTANLETLLESRMLDVLSANELGQLSRFIQSKQKEKSPATRTSLLVDRSMAMFGDWLAQQDIAEPIIRSNRSLAPRVTHVPRISKRSLTHDDIFMMDDVEPAFDGPASPPPPIHASVWKVPNASKTDMRALLGEVPNPIDSDSGSKRVQRSTSDQPMAATASSPSLPRTSTWKSLPQPSYSPNRESNFPKLGQTPQSRQPSQFGQVFTPTKPSKPSPSSVRSPSSGNVWTSPTSSSPPQTASGISFAAIQQQQREQATPLVKEKHSLLEIQKQEEDRRTEEEFLKWWATEEERLKESTNTGIHHKDSVKSKKKRKSGNRSHILNTS